MNRASAALLKGFMKIGPRMLPFADAATEELPLGRLLRLALFQMTVGMAIVLLIGTLNRVMIVELGVPSWIVALMLSLPLLSAPLRTLVGFRSDHHRSVLGWRRVPFIWFGTMAQFGGFAIMPFAILILSGDAENGPRWAGQIAAALAFLLVGLGLHTVQTVGLALATDLAPERARPRVVALLCAMLLLGMVVSAVVFGFALRNFGHVKLIQVVQGAAVATIVLNSVALWKQEPRNFTPIAGAARLRFASAWATFSGVARRRRRLVAIALGTAGFSMQDVLLEPYGGKVLHLPVGATTALTAMLAVGGGVGLWMAARRLNRGSDAHRVAGWGAVVGVVAFACVILAAPSQSAVAFGLGVALIGIGSGLFAHGTLTASMADAKPEERGLALGAWGAAQATAAGLAIAVSGFVNDFGANLAMQGVFGDTLADPVTGFSLVYAIEICLLLATIVAIGPLSRRLFPSADFAASAFAASRRVGLNPGGLP